MLESGGNNIDVNGGNNIDVDGGGGGNIDIDGGGGDQSNIQRRGAVGGGGGLASFCKVYGVHPKIKQILEGDIFEYMTVFDQLLQKGIYICICLSSHA